ncbi:MAG: MFS transporter [Planctomycetes bacterium]|nr:MFS transporter [Planctomycetota bacterium]
MVLIAAFLGWLFDGYEMGMFPVIARPALRDLLEGAGEEAVGAWMSYITALFLVGAALGGLVFGWLGDRIGRVRSMSLSILTYSLCTGLGYLARENWHLGALRFLAALGMGGEWSLGVALVMECWPERLRPYLAGAIGAAANVGFLFVGIVALAKNVTVESWRWMMLVGAAPALLVFFIRLFVPESQRWQAAVSRGAAKPVREIFSRPYLKRTLLAIAFASIALIGTWGSVQWTPIWVDQMTEGKEPRAKAVVQIFSALGAISGCLLAPIAGGRIGRRPAFFGLCLASLLICGYLFRAVHAYNFHFLVVIFLTGGATAAFYGWFPLYLPELFPTRMRATGQGVSYNTGRIFAAAGALTQGQLVGTFGGSYPKAGAVVTLIYALGLALIWLAPETRGKPLPD